MLIFRANISSVPGHPSFCRQEVVSVLHRGDHFIVADRANSPECIGEHYCESLIRSPFSNFPENRVRWTLQMRELLSGLS